MGRPPFGIVLTSLRRRWAYEPNPRAHRRRRPRCILRLTGGQVAHCTESDALTDILDEGDILLADKGCGSDGSRVKAAEREAWAIIPPKADRKGSFAFSRWVYRQLTPLDRFFNRIKQFRGTATRYDKRPVQQSSLAPGFSVRVYEPTP